MSCFSVIHIKQAEAETKTVTFRPLYSGYLRGTVLLMGTDENTTAINREWNLETWNLTQQWDYDKGEYVSTLTMHITYCEPSWYFWPYSGGIYYAPPVKVFISVDKGMTFNYSIQFGTKTLEMKSYWSSYNESSNWLYAIGSYSFPFSNATLFGPNTRVKVMFVKNYPIEGGVWIGNYYFGSTQKPVPPFDYQDVDGSYVQYAISWTAEYTELPITYSGSTTSFNYTSTKSRLAKAANMILNTTFPSGASNEVTGKFWGTDSWIVIYSSQISMIELIDLIRIFPEKSNDYLRSAKRFIVWMWSQQWTDGSFPFILTDGDLHPWTDPDNDLYYGWDKIDSFSACAISLMRKYYEATNDTDFLERFWYQTVKAKDFMWDLLNMTSWIPVDGYHYNGTHYIKSEYNWMHDSCEYYQGLKDYAYLCGVMGLSADQTYFNNVANSIAAAIRTELWNETLHRYVGIYNVVHDTQDSTRVYNTICPIVYGIENNITKAVSTIQDYLNWGILTGRYYNKPWAADYSIYNEYATMSGMIVKSFFELIDTWNYTDLWVKIKLIEITKFLFANPIYPGGDLQNNNGFLDYVNLVNYTYATEYARLIETSGWIINGFVKMNELESLFNFTASELAAVNQTLYTEGLYWSDKYAEFKAWYGEDWNSTDSSYSAWISWLKEKGEYVAWYDYMFLLYLYTHGIPPDWWEHWDPSDDWIGDTFVGSEYLLPLGFVLGLGGVFALIFGPCYGVVLLKRKQYQDALISMTIITLVGFCFIMGWLWS